MDIEDGPSPTDASFLDSLSEPWKSIASKVVPSADAESLSPASERLEQLELDSRSHVIELLKDPKRSNAEDIGECWTAALNLCLHMVHHATSNSLPKDSKYADIAPRKLPLVLIEDCLDGLTITECKKFWSEYVEAAFGVLFGDLFWKSSNACRLQFLRVCNQFLNRMEATNYEWKGRIMMALARGFSIADRSALKMWGNFHASDNNEYETQEEFETSNKAPVSSTSPAADYSLYRAFWSLQSDFSNPNRIQVADFINKMKVVLNALESANIVKKTQSMPTSKSQRYLTSSSLFLTQLETQQFRTSVISQFLIVAAHLSAESKSLANALSTLLERAKKVLQNDNPELYTLLWDSILSTREVQWRKWKKAGKCTATAFAPKRSLEEPTGDPEKMKRSRLLDVQLGGGDSGNDSSKYDSKQYEIMQKDELMKISQTLSQATPSLEKHLAEYVDALDPEAGIEDEYHPKNDSMFTWRAMRLYAKHQLPLLKNCRKPDDLERMTRRWYLDQGKEIPGEMPASDSESEDESTMSGGSNSDKEGSHDESMEQDKSKEAAADNDVEMKAADNEASPGMEETQKEGAGRKDSVDEAESNSTSPENTESLDEGAGDGNKKEEEGIDTDEGNGSSAEKVGEAESKDTIKMEEVEVRIESEDASEAESVSSKASGKEEEATSPVAVVKDGDDEKAGLQDLAADSNPASRQESEDDLDEVGTKKETENTFNDKSRSNSKDRRSMENRPRDSGNTGRGRDKSDNRGSRRGRSDDAPRGGRRDERDASRGGRREDRHDEGRRGDRRDERYDDGARGGNRSDRYLDGPRGGRRDGSHDDGPRGGRREDRFDDGSRGGRGGQRGGSRGGGRGGGDRRDERRVDDRRRRGGGGRGRL